MSNIISVASATGTDAIHPGYGFLAENADFSELCEECNIKFIGPSAEAIRKMGVKDIARKTMDEAGVPIVPGSDGIVEDEAEAIKVAEEIGYPMIIKATAGGGGRGIRVARDEESLKSGMRITQKEAETAFGNTGVYLEIFIEDVHHVEIQQLADEGGTVSQVGVGDCSIQRRLQKVVRDTPSPPLTEEVRGERGDAPEKAAKAVNCTGAGTNEGIFDRKDHKLDA